MSIVFDEPMLAEAEEIARVHVQCWQESYAGLLPPEFLRRLSADARVAQWQEAISDPDVLSMGGNNQATAFYEALGGVQVYEGSFEIAGTRMTDKSHLFSNLADLAAQT